MGLWELEEYEREVVPDALELSAPGAVQFLSR
jgi:hypothetical protein